MASRRSLDGVHKAGAKLASGLMAAALIAAWSFAVRGQTLQEVDPATLPGDVRRLIVFAPSKTHFADYGGGYYVLTYESTTYNLAKKMRTGGKARHLRFVSVMKWPNADAALESCQSNFQAMESVKGANRTVRTLEGFDCAYIVEVHPYGDRSKWEYEEGGIARHYGFAKGVFFVVWEDSAQPVSMMPTSSAYGSLLQAIDGGEPLSAGEIAFRNVLFRTGLKFGGDAARSCLDEVMNTAEAAAAKDPKMADEIAQLRKAAARAHAIEVLAALPVGPEYFDDFDPKWWEAVKEVTPSPFAPADPRDTSTDVAVEWLPPSLKWLINITRAADKGMRAIKKHVVDRAMQGELFACYRTIRPSYPAVISRASAEAYEEQLSHILFDVVGSCHSAGAAGFQAGYGKVSNEEFRRLSRPVAVRFEVIYQIEDARNHRDARIDEHWAPVQDILARLKARVNTCIADRVSRSR